MLSIKTSLDWQSTESQIKKLGTLVPMFDHDIQKIIKHISEEIRILSQLEVEYRNTKSKSAGRQCDAQADKINQITMV